MTNSREFNKKLYFLQLEKQEEADQVKRNHIKRLIELHKEHDKPIRFKEKIHKDDLLCLIGYVLDTYQTGPKTIKAYAEVIGKTDQWKKDIAQNKAKDTAFKEMLELLEDHEAILSMIKNNVYDKKDILKNTITGALTKLSKQMKLSKKLDDSKKEEELFRKLREIRENNDQDISWIEEAQILRDSGKSLNQISEIVNKCRSAVGKYTTPKKRV